MQLAHDRTGSGPPLVLMHGIGMSRAVWRPVVPLLEREREVVAVDLPGFGASPAGPATVQGVADAVAAFVREIGLDRPHVAGNSLGGGLALALGAAGAARSVCGLSPIGFATGRERGYARAVLVGTRGLSRLLAPVAPTLARSDTARALLAAHATARPRRIPPSEAAVWARDFADATAFWSLLGDIGGWTAPRPTCPVTLAWGEHDRLMPHTRQSARARRALPAARHTVLRGCGHVPTWDDPAQVARLLLEASAT